MDLKRCLNMPRIPLSAVWTSVFLVTCLFMTTARTSDWILRRCCEENQVLRRGICVPSSNSTPYSPPIDANLSETIKWKVECPRGYKKRYFPLDNSLRINVDSINLIGRGRTTTFYNITNFCVGLDADGEDKYIAAFCFLKELGVAEGMVTNDKVEVHHYTKVTIIRNRTLEIKDQVQIVGMIVSCIFLSLTIVLHLAIPTLRDIQSLCLLCHMISLLVTNAVICTNSLFVQDAGHRVANAFILQYSFLATFFWLNVMCYDVWRIVKETVNLVPLVRITPNEKKKFFMYCAYAWGVPLVIVCVTAVLHFLPDHLLHDSVIRPEFEVSWLFRNDYALLCYFYGFVGLLFFMNLVLLGHTIVMMVKAGVIFSSSRNTTFTAFNRNHFDVFKLRFSLFCLMALCWVTEILSWKIHPLEIWILTDIINSLQGFIVFVIFISNKKKREAVSNLCKKSTKNFRTETKGVIWYVTEDEATITNSDNSKNTQITDGNMPELEGATQETLEV